MYIKKDINLSDHNLLFYIFWYLFCLFGFRDESERDKKTDTCNATAHSHTHTHTLTHQKTKPICFHCLSAWLA
jgi:hypothetical protein